MKCNYLFIIFLFISSFISKESAIAKPIEDFSTEDELRIEISTVDQIKKNYSKAINHYISQGRKVHFRTEKDGGSAQLLIPGSARIGLPKSRLDVNKDCLITASDALLIINFLNLKSYDSSIRVQDNLYLDVTDDGNISPIDVLNVVNELNHPKLTRDDLCPYNPAEKGITLVSNNNKGAYADFILDDGTDEKYISFTGLGQRDLTMGGANRFIVPYVYSGINGAIPEGKVVFALRVYSGSEDEMSTCKATLSDINPRQTQIQQTGQFVLRFEDCESTGRMGKADFSKVSLIIGTLYSSGQDHSELTIKKVLTNGSTLISPEEYDYVPSTPVPTRTPTPTPSLPSTPPPVSPSLTPPPTMPITPTPTLIPPTLPPSTPPLIEVKCPFVKLSANLDKIVNVSSVSEMSTFDNDSPDCLKNKMQDVVSRCIGSAPASLLSNCIVRGTLDIGRLNNSWARDIPIPSWAPQWKTSNSGVTTAGLYLDRNCNPVNQSEINNLSKVCNASVKGFLGIRWYTISPISLILDDGSDFENNTSVVSFPLSNTDDNKFYTWKGSSNSPLLVYDPERKGHITSATQLFGSYTFGASKTWENGYQALGTLDKNKDGFISGVELESLSLWFDNNRDGISDLGEVKNIKEFGIIKLFYNNPEKVKDSRDMVLFKGFERTKDGKIISGKSIDWFAIEGNSKSEVVEKITTVSKDTVDADFSSASIDKGAESELITWKVKDSSSTNNGYLSLAINYKTKEVSGYSIGEIKVGKNETNISSYITLNPLMGKIAQEQGGKLDITFDVFDGVSKLATTNMHIDKINNVVSGTTWKGDKDSNLSYQWEGARSNL